jgi:hypothetical protein
MAAFATCARAINAFLFVSDGPFIIIIRMMLRRVGKGNQPVMPRVSFGESDDRELEIPALKENSPPKSEAVRHKPQESLSSKFAQRWGHQDHAPAAPLDLFDDVPADPSDIPAEDLGQLRREKGSQSPESILQDINLMVEHVREICSKRPK